MYKKLCILILLPFILSTAQEEKISGNPFFTEWTTPYGTAPFNLIKTEHYMPAFNEGMKQQNAELEQIVNNTEAPTFENTIEALEKSGKLLEKVSSVFFNLYNTEFNDDMQKISSEIVPLLTKHENDLYLNQDLFNKIKTVYTNREKISLTPEQQVVLEKYYKDFVRQGADLKGEDRDKFRKINEELSLLSLKFSENVLKETNAYELIVDTEEDLAGLPGPVIEAAKDAAAKRGYENKWLFTLHAPSYRPFIMYSSNRELREKFFKASQNRGNNDNENDNKEVVSKIVSLRFQRANLLGYKSHAHFTLEPYMAKTPERVYEFLDKLYEPAKKLAVKERDELQQLINREGNNFKLEPWDWPYYSEKLKLEKYSLDEEALRPYFKMENVLAGLFDLTNKLYGLTFEERSDIVTYNEDVKVFEIKNTDDSHVGIIYMDYFPRESKRAGAWMNVFRSQNKIGGKEVTPIIVNCGNLNKPTNDKPSLLSLDEVKTIFHEFGHALHGLLSDVTYPKVSGTNVAWDFVELPSQIMENWASNPEVLRSFAKHYETGEVMPDSLIDRIQNAKLFNKGYETISTYLAPSYLDMKYHTITTDAPVDVKAVEEEVSKDIIPEIGLRYRSTINSHIFAGGYSAGYYSYIWAEVLDADAFEAFVENGLYNKQTAAAFRDNILSKGGSDDPMVLYKKFRGKEPSTEPLLKRRGLK
jgi:peptidyl-dipeptidase Dcp